MPLATFVIASESEAIQESALLELDCFVAANGAPRNDGGFLLAYCATTPSGAVSRLNAAANSARV
jgi:hypothetical protein